jgi:hypothetical protein
VCSKSSTASIMPGLSDDRSMLELHDSESLGLVFFV